MGPPSSAFRTFCGLHGTFSEPFWLGLSFFKRAPSGAGAPPARRASTVCGRVSRILCGGTGLDPRSEKKCPH
eukprot:624743-Pyramimonas_sp.AAC.1